MRGGALKHWALACASLAVTGPAWATPTDGGIDFQRPATEVARDVMNFHNEVLVIIAAITVFVTALLMWVMIRYNKRANPVPRKFSHNTLVEILWTVVPVLILVYIAYKSFPLLYEQDVMPEQAVEEQIVDIKVYGHQWYWRYIYGEGDNVTEVESRVVPVESLKAGQIPLLSVDNPMVAPVNRYVRLSVTAQDVIHAWAMPQFAIKVDAVPGRLNQLWFNAEEPGIYFGQCSELCGANHAFMPIELRILPQAQYDEWLRRVQTSASEARAYLDQVQPTTGSQVAAR
ncbi:MAG TPA: cytochrome c oxidase subunit II [Hyphomonadaceae bacterium]|jgi:cytochrome c oxidase subunit 2